MDTIHRTQNHGHILSMNLNIQYKIGILGCGAIFNRHFDAIKFNSDNYELLGIYDPNLINSLGYRAIIEHNIKIYNSELELLSDDRINCIVVLTPNYLHFSQMLNIIQHKKHIIVEKPAVFNISELQELINLATIYQVNIFTILQVRLNPVILAVQDFLTNYLNANIRSCSLVQKWQRPDSYFNNWRGSLGQSGGILREFAIHYLDIMQLLIGMPNKINFAKTYNTKQIKQINGIIINNNQLNCNHNDQHNHEDKNNDYYDTLYANLDYGNFAANCEFSIASEPHNIECSLTISTDKGYIKFGGKSLDKIIDSDFIDNNNEHADTNNYNIKYDDILHKLINIYQKKSSVELAKYGVSPYHPEVYYQIIHNPKLFSLPITYNVIRLIEDILKYT